MGKFQAAAFPFPNYVRISAVPDGLPADEAVFLGAWEGKWPGDQTSILVVTDINPKTSEVRGIYGWGKWKKRNKAGSGPITGKIGLGKKGNKVLRWTSRNGSKASFRVWRRDPTKLKGKIKWKGDEGDREQSGIFSRTKLYTDL